MSIKLALECPTSMLEVVQPFADFDFLLTHLVLADEKYLEYYKTSRRRKILDNSVNELGIPSTLEDIKKAEELLGGVDFIVSPDFIGEGDKTLEAFIKSAEDYKEKTIPVLQGSTFEEALFYLNIYLSFYKGPFTLAVPYDLCSKKTDSPILMGTRRALIVSYVSRFQNIFVHLLGFNSIEEFIFYRERPNIISLDTGAPVLLGLQSKDILEPLESKEKPTMELMENLKLTDKTYGSICRNIALLRKEL